MNLFREQLKRDRFLLTLHKLADGQTGEPIKEIDLLQSMKMESDEFHKTRLYLTDEGLIKGVTFGTVGLTHTGRKEAEHLIALPYKEKAFRVLWMIRELSNGSLTKLVLSEDFARMLAIEPREIYPIVNDLHERGLIDALNEAVLMLPAGLEALEAPPEQSPRTSGDNYYTTIHNLQGGAQIGGAGNTQYININPEFDKAISGLVQLVNSSGLTSHDKEDLEDEIRKVNQLALRDPGPGLLEKVKSRLEVIKVSLSAADLLIKGGPLLETIWAYFKHKYGI